MSDPLRTDAARQAGNVSASDRDGKIEQLLLAGLDHYFANQYEQAINVWTRALFFDRNHARARAYIERARSALAERQRESEELLQQGIAAFQQGEADEARRLLKAAIAAGAPSENALAILDRLDRLERVTDVPDPAVPTRWRAAAVPPPSELEGRSPRRPWLWVGLGVLAGGPLLALVVMGVVSRSVAMHGLSSPAGSAVVPTPSDPVLPLPRQGEISLARARRLAAAGRLDDALKTLDLVRPTDTEKAEADQLRAQLQRQLIELARVSPPQRDDERPIGSREQ